MLSSPALIAGVEGNSGRLENAKTNYCIINGVIYFKQKGVRKIYAVVDKEHMSGSRRNGSSSLVESHKMG